MKFWLDVDGALLRQAAALADPIRKALVASIDVENVLDQWERTYPEGTPITRIEGRQWAKATVDVDEQPLIDVLGDVYATGFVMGDLVATASYGHESMKTKAGDKKPQPPSPELVDIAISVDWSKWKPGNKPAEALMSPKGPLRKLLRSRKKLVNDVSLTTVNSIGNILARGLGAGTDRFTLATMIDEYLDNPSRSLMISTTELTRGMQTTALEQFKEFGNKVRWLALDPCEFCAGNAAEGTVSPGYEFKDVNGSTIYNPPAHPHCRCALTPVVDLNPDIPSLDLALQAAMLKYSETQARDYRGRWTSGSGMPGWQKLLPDEKGRKEIYDRIYAKTLAERPGDTETAETMAGLAQEKYDQRFVNYTTYAMQDNGTYVLEVDNRLPDAPKIAREYATYVEGLAKAYPSGSEKTTVTVTSEELLSGGTTNGYQYSGKYIAVNPLTADKTIKLAHEGWNMPGENASNTREFVLAHEWGHMVDYHTEFFASDETHSSVLALGLKSKLSEYGRSDWDMGGSEGFAEMFSQAYMEGKYPNLPKSELTPLLNTTGN